MKKLIWRILLVDDDEDDFFITRTTLADARQRKFIVEWASSYEKGRQMILSGGYDAVLVDDNLGRHSGMGLLLEVSAMGDTTPALILTGRSSPEKDVPDVPVGVIDFLNKNEMNPALLELAIRFVIEQKHGQQQLVEINSALNAANARLAASRREVNQILESVSDSFLVIDLQYHVLYINRRAANSSHLEPEDIIGRNIWQVFPELIDSPLWSFYQQVMKTRQPGVLEMQAIKQPGQWYEVSAFPIEQGISIFWKEISKQLQAKQAVERERIFLQTALDQMLSGVIIAEAPSGRLMLVNRQAENIWRHPVSAARDLEGQEIYLGFFPDGAPYQPEDWPLARSLRSAEVVRNEEINILRGDGSYGVILVNSTPLLDPQAKMTAAVMTFLDITERKRAELDTFFLIELTDLINRLENPQALLAAIAVKVAKHLETARCIISSIDQDQAAITVDTGHPGEFQPLSGSYPIFEMGEGVAGELRLGRPVVVRNAITDPIVPLAMRVFQEENEIRSYLAVPLLQGGVLKAVLAVLDSRPRNWNERQIAFLQTVAERAWAAYETRGLVVALRSSEERAHLLADHAQFNLHKLETVINSMNEAVLLFQNDVFIRINPAAAALHGFRSEDEMKRSAESFDLLFEASTSDGTPIERADLPLARAGRGEPVINREIHFHRKDTNLRWIGLYSAVPIRDAGGAIVFVLETIVDITPIRLAEQQHSELAARLQMQHLLVEQREQERLQLARDLHDGPIQSLIGLIFSLQSAEIISTDEAVLMALSSAREDAQRLVAELRGVCNALRPPLLDKFGLSKAILSLVDELRQRSPGLTFKQELDDDVHQLDDEIRLALYRIFQESINNVLRHANASEVIIRLALHPDDIILEVSDNGIGFVMPDDWLSLARQGHLGLAGIKERVEAIGAQLEISSRPGEGTRVMVTLPRR